MSAVVALLLLWGAVNVACAAMNVRNSHRNVRAAEANVVRAVEPLAHIEPSSDMRQGARAMTEMRAALIGAGYTPEQASRQIADMITSQSGEQS